MRLSAELIGTGFAVGVGAGRLVGGTYRFFLNDLCTATYALIEPCAVARPA